MASATVRRRRLGAELRRLREAAGLTCEDVAAHLECSHSKVSRIELGRAGCRPRDVRDMLDLYGITDQEQREPLERLSRNPRERNWWTKYQEHLPAPYYTYVDLEAAASSVTAYEPLYIHGLLQTEEYARATVLGGLRSLPNADAEQRVSARLERQANRASSGSQLWVIIDESVLHRSIGATTVLLDQLAYLVKVADERTILQVLPWSAGLLPGVAGPFTMLEFEHGDTPTVYVETMAGDLYIDGEREVTGYRTAMERLRAMAMSPEQSLEHIHHAIVRLEKEVNRNG